MTLIIRDQLVTPPTWFASFRDLTLYCHIFLRDEIVIESEDVDTYYRWIKPRGGMDFIEDFVRPGAEDGMIVRTAASGDLVSSASYGDFELSIEWKVADETNSGILYRVDLGQDQTYFSGPEYQLLDNVHGGDRFDPKHRAGAREMARDRAGLLPVPGTIFHGRMELKVNSGDVD